MNNFTQRRIGGGGFKGEYYGFPYVIGAWCNGRLKLDPIHKYLNSIKEPVTEYVGIAKDEPKRLKRYKKLETEKHKYITLADFDMSEREAMELCKKYDLLSPIYKSSFRGGCWFCPKQSIKQLKHLYESYPQLFHTLKGMEKDSHNTFKPNYTLEQLEKKFKVMQLTIFDKEKKDD